MFLRKFEYLYSMSIASPCKLICRYGENELCVGCYRSRDEITHWIGMTDEQKLEVWKNIRIRKSSNPMRNGHHGKP